MKIHPNNIKSATQEEYLNAIKEIRKLYDIDNLYEESLIWYKKWKNQNIDSYLVDMLKNHTEFFSAIHEAISIMMTSPATIRLIERSFSTLRRVKTWLRSTMISERFSSLCLLTCSS